MTCEDTGGGRGGSGVFKTLINGEKLKGSKGVSRRREEKEEKDIKVEVGEGVWDLIWTTEQVGLISRETGRGREG